ncbi:MAG: Replicative DNA helicase [bacterium ADurb.Bin157]|jgi:replicative DNA helicase|nr:replicative DNA helicase [Candidatus Riflebacteria bacterium]NCB46483.1 replicative DNA helicase [bacterium]OQB50318.1 MAG: Replicative DNA helicase [bacterium ADurb.Bin157]MDD2624867.1 replicative DNA helicase [Candidatus Riflebacteria bacterium]MDD3377365.1 replicative DNA helicase [Candidatus Riflebacteria bacterium]
MSDIFQKVPPHSIEAEQSLIGSMMLSEDAIVAAMELVSSSDFYQSAHRTIYEGIFSLYSEHKPCDLVTLQEQLRSQGKLAEVGGVSYISQMLNVVPTSKNAEHYAKIVKDKAMLRQLISLTGEISDKAYDPSTKTELILDETEQKVLKLSQFKSTKSFHELKDLVKETFAHLEQLYENKQPVTGIPSGFIDLDAYTAGFQKSDLVILAARPSMGKTAFCLNLAQNAAYKTKTPIMFFSLEMSHTQLVTRLLCSEARVNGNKLRTGMVDEEDWGKIIYAAGILEDTPLLIDDTANASLLEIRSKARKAYAQHKIGMIIIDYLQLITYSGTDKAESRQQEVSAISRSLKGLARELDIPVICLSQLSREVEKRTDKRPQLSDLRESGAIEQDADVVMFLYRDYYYNKQREENRGKGEVIIAKQRNGGLGSVELAFNENFAKFENLDRIHREDY